MKNLKQRRIKQQNNSEEHILPLINVVFLLLIFFMIAGRLTSADPFQLDPSKSISSTQTDPESAIIHIGENNQLAFQNRETSKEELLHQVSEHMINHPGALLRLKVDANHGAGQVLTLMTDLRAVGVEKVSLLTQLESTQ